MKKIIVTLLLVFSLAAVISGCGASKKTGCPGTEGIIH